MPNSPLYLIDASIFIFRGWHCMPQELVDCRGRQVNALYGFARFMGDVLEESQATQIVVAFDECGRNGFRNRLYAPYKANRAPRPIELSRQFTWCRELCRVLGITTLDSPEYEADDIIGTLSAQAQARGQSVVLLTQDKDLAQLIRPGDVFWDQPKRKRYHYDDIAKQFGVRPELLASFLALSGDQVDNVPGVPKVGGVTAARLLEHFGSLEAMYERIEEVPKVAHIRPGFIYTQLQGYRESALLSLQLTTIIRDMPLSITVEQLTRRPLELAQFDAFCDGANFGDRLRQQARRIAQRDEAACEA